MASRFLLTAGLIAVLVGVAEPASARPRRFARVQSQPAATNTEPIKSVIHPVADLVVAIPSRPNLDVEPLPRLRRSEEATESQSLKAIWNSKHVTLLPGQTMERQLMELVRNTVAPTTWKENGGVGTVQYYPLGMALVVHQTLAVQEEVAAKLETLRRMQDIETAVEVRVVTSTPAAFEKACKELKLTRLGEKDNPAAVGMRSVAPKGKRWTAFLDDDQLYQILASLQTDRNTTVMQAPKITTFNDQNVALECTENRFFLTSIEFGQTAGSDQTYFIPNQSPWVTGLSLGLNSVVSADHQFVRVKMKGYWSQLAGPVEMQRLHTHIKTKDEQGKEEPRPFQVFLQKPSFAQVRLDEELNIPDGGTALISCGVVPMEVERTDLVACISKFLGSEKMTTSADCHVFFLITPRVIINETEEQQLLAPVPPVLVRP